jgi:hypothetical protein
MVAKSGLVYDLTEQFPSDEELQLFHRQSKGHLVSSPQMIKTLWKEFRENSNSKNGKINREVFLRVLSQHFSLDSNDIAKALFKREG